MRIAALLLLLAPALAAAQPMRSIEGPLTMEGVGPFRIGMTEGEMRALHPGFLTDEGFEDAECHYLADGINLPGLGFMIVGGRLARIDVFEGDIATAEGARIGSNAPQLLAMYPRNTRVEAHPYGDDTDKVIHHASPHGGSAMAFEVVGGATQSYRAGLHGPVQFIEGCL